MCLMHADIKMGKVRNHARVKLTPSLCCVASKGHGVESLGDITITAAAGKTAALRMSVKRADQHLFTSKWERERYREGERERDRSSSYKVLCWIMDPSEGRKRVVSLSTSWCLPLDCDACMSLQTFPGALCNLLKRRTVLHARLFVFFLMSCHACLSTRQTARAPRPPRGEPCSQWVVVQ